MTKDFKELRENFGLFATGVAVASTSEGNNYNFITINSLSSISLDPALLLFCIDNNSSNFEAFTNNKKFAINLLTEEQIGISRIFSHHGQDDINISDLFFKSDLNNHILKDSLGYFECETHQIILSGDHNIIIGKIVNFAKINADKQPLIYYKGEYGL